jgi:hypothetical protein
MNLEEVLRRKFYREQLEQSDDETPVCLPISCNDMSDTEKNSFIQFLAAESHRKDQQNSRLQKTIDDQGERLNAMQLTLEKIESAQHATRDENIKLNAQLLLQSKNLKKLQSDSAANSQALNKALREAAKYRSLYEVLRDEKFVGTSQKSGKSRPAVGRDDDKDEWTGTGNAGDDESNSDTVSVTEPEAGKENLEHSCSESANTDSVVEHKKKERPYRQGLKYNTMKAEATILHKCDLTRIPADATIVKTEIRSSFHFISRIEEHQQEYVTYRTKDGRLVTSFYPMKKPAQGSVSETLSEDVHTDNTGAYDEEGQILKNFPGTHATVDMLVELVFNAYMLETPVYRDMIRLFELKFKVSRQTILNWLSKGSAALKKLLPVLKSQALEKDSIINCDETWCRVKMQDKYKKAYIWCLVNKSAGIVIFFYDEGSRSRKVLTDFIEDSDIAALQSDAYNVYKYLDGELSEVEHICCMAHVRARFQKALLQGKDELARPFMKWIGRLYDFERCYSNDDLPPDEIKRRRNGSETTEIVGSIWMELTRLLDDPLPKGDLITKALHYLKNAWTPIMAYRNNGRYCIDNSIAERSIRTLTIERKNKMAFGSHKGAETSTVYHTFIGTCKMGALSFYQFLKQYLTAFMEGRTDFENLTPAILGKIN